MATKNDLDIADGVVIPGMKPAVTQTVVKFHKNVGPVALPLNDGKRLAIELSTNKFDPKPNKAKDRFKMKKRDCKHKSYSSPSARRGTRCSVYQCGNTQNDEKGYSTGLQFFIIPFDKTMANEWIGFLRLAAGGKDVKVNASTKICCAHFIPEQLDACYNPKTGKYRLKTGIVPQILPKSIKEATPDQLGIAPNNIINPSYALNSGDLSAGQSNAELQVISSLRPATNSTYTCEDCERVFFCYGDYYQHSESHSGLPGNQRHSQQVPCVECNLFFSGTHSVMKHMKEHTTDKAYKCVLCLGGFDSPKERTEHFSSAHQPSSDQDCQVVSADPQLSEEECVIIDLSEEEEIPEPPDSTGPEPSTKRTIHHLHANMDNSLDMHSSRSSSSDDSAIMEVSGNEEGARPHVNKDLSTKMEPYTVCAKCFGVAQAYASPKSFVCQHCGWDKAEVQPSSTKEEKDGNYPVKKSAKQFLNRPVIVQPKTNIALQNQSQVPQSYNHDNTTLPMESSSKNYTGDTIRPKGTTPKKRRIKFIKYTCGECPDNFICFGDYYQHQQAHVRRYRSNKKAQKEPQVIPCLVCSQLFPSGSQVIEHMSLHTQALPFRCDVCGDEFQSFLERKMHNSKPCGFDVEEMSDEESSSTVMCVQGPTNVKLIANLREVEEVVDISDDELAFVNEELEKYCAGQN